MRTVVAAIVACVLTAGPGYASLGLYRALLPTTTTTSTSTSTSLATTTSTSSTTTTSTSSTTTTSASTSSSTTSSSTTTTTSTSSTTSTVPTTEHIWLHAGAFPDSFVNSIDVATTTNQLWCAETTAQHSITNATHLAFRFGAGVSDSGTFGIALYDQDGDPRYGYITQSYTTASDNLPFSVALSASVSITAGTTYRLCWCASSTGAEYYGFNTNSVLTNDERMRDAMNIHGTVRVGYTGTGCSTGVPPTTATGTLTEDAGSTPPAPPLVLLEK